MNRAERRKKGVKKVKSYTLNEHQIKDMEFKMQKDAADFAMQLTIGFSLLALRDEFGFGGKRMDRFIDKVKELVDYYSEDYFSLEDMVKIVEEETGIKVEM
mgnify:CR=1 FL=1